MYYKKYNKDFLSIVTSNNYYNIFNITIIFKIIIIYFKTLKNHVKTKHKTLK